MKRELRETVGDNGLSPCRSYPLIFKFSAEKHDLKPQKTHSDAFPGHQNAFLIGSFSMTFGLPILIVDRDMLTLDNYMLFYFALGVVDIDNFALLSEFGDGSTTGYQKTQDYYNLLHNEISVT
ncbi:MAG: hypothetical protein HUU08_17250 [Candidatus Brocadia sp.]|nr:hypothetical protein [Candidatus Brocadia sp.]